MKKNRVKRVLSKEDEICKCEMLLHVYKSENGHYVLTNCWHFPLKCGHQVWPYLAVVRVVSWVM
jgi:hypothetical protein